MDQSEVEIGIRDILL